MSNLIFNIDEVVCLLNIVCSTCSALCEIYGPLVNPPKSCCLALVKNLLSRFKKIQDATMNR